MVSPLTTPPKNAPNDPEIILAIFFVGDETPLTPPRHKCQTFFFDGFPFSKFEIIICFIYCHTYWSVLLILKLKTFWQKSIKAKKRKLRDNATAVLFIVAIFLHNFFWLFCLSILEMSDNSFANSTTVQFFIM